LLCAVAAGLLSRTPFLERWELRTQDCRFERRGPRKTGAKIVIAAIADSTLEAWQEPMASWGAHYAAAITNARELGASWIGLDFIQGISGGEDSDQQLALALHGGRVVLSQMRSSGKGPIPALAFARPEQPSDIGFVDARLDLDNVVRHAAVWENEGDRLAASFPAVLALRLRHQSPTDAAALRSLAGAAGQRSGAGSVWINYVGPPRSFPYLLVERLAAGNLSTIERNHSAFA
jgi:CHASE2 domain-containing sensor protein